MTPTRAPDLALIASPSPSLTWVGHATFVLRLGGKLIATDPIWSERLAGDQAARPPGVALADLPPLDVVTVSHNHYDHLDAPTIARIGAAPLYVTPLGNGRWLQQGRRRQHRRARLVAVAHRRRRRDHARARAPLVDARPVEPQRRLVGRLRLPQRRGSGVAYHSGDTALFDGFTEIGQRFGPIDWAMLPIGAYEPRWFMEPQHMNPEDAGEAFVRLGARRLCAMHWGTFKLTDEPLGEPPRRIRKFFADRDLGDERLWIFDVGETRALTRS